MLKSKRYNIYQNTFVNDYGKFLKMLELGGLMDSYSD